MRILRRRPLTDKVGLSSTQIDRLEARGEFPRRVRLGPQAVGWIEDEVDDWIEARVSERDNEKAPLTVADGGGAMKTQSAIVSTNHESDTPPTPE